jgi:hypothetical protein
MTLVKSLQRSLIFQKSLEFEATQIPEFLGGRFKTVWKN